MANPYKDEAGHFTSKANDGGPCKHKRINGGKYEYSEDGGKTWKAFSRREEYDAYETDEDEKFDENIEDDFGFDDPEDKTPDEWYDTDEEGERHFRETNGYVPESGDAEEEDNEDEWDNDEEGERYFREKYGESSEPSKDQYDFEYYDELVDEMRENGIDLGDKDAVAKELRENYQFEDDAVRHFVDDYMYVPGVPVTDDGEQLHQIAKEWAGSKNGNNLNPDNPKYKNLRPSDATNVKQVGETVSVEDIDSGKTENYSIIEYIPYGSLERGDNRKLYGIVTDYDGSDTFNKGIIVAPSLESAKDQLESQLQLAEQGSERYTKRGKWDEDYFNILRDKEYGWSDEDKADVSKRYGWDLNKEWADQDHVKNAKTGKRKIINQKIEDQVKDGVTEDDVGYVRQVLQDIPGVNKLTNDQIKKIISSIRNR